MNKADANDDLFIGIDINLQDAFGQVRSLDDIIGEFAADAVREFKRVEEATQGAIRIGSGVATVKQLSSAILDMTNADRLAVEETRRLESAGEGLVRSLEKANAAFGRSRDEIRAAKVETTALAAEQAGMTELAGRLRANLEALNIKHAEAAANAARGAQAIREAAGAHMAFEAAARRGIAAMREQEAAEAAAAREAQQMAAAADRLRASIDPSVAAQQRFNREIEDAQLLISRGAISLDEYAAKLRMERAALDASVAGFGAVGASGKLAGHHMQNLAFQFQDVGMQMFAASQSSEPLKMAFMAIIQQGTQIYGIMSQAGVGIRGVGAAFLTMSKAILVATATNPYLLAGAAAIAAFAGAVKLFQNEANASNDMKKYAESLGLTAKEIRNLDNVTVTFGDTAKAVFQVAGRAIWDSIGPSVSSAWSVMKEWISWIASAVKKSNNFTIGSFVGAYNVITSQWEAFPAVIGDVFFSAVNAAIAAINQLISKTIDGMNYVATQANRILPEALQIPQLDAPQISQVNNQYAGAYAKFGKTARDEMNKALGVDYIGRIGGAISGAVSDQAAKNAQDRIRAQAEEKGYLDPESMRPTGSTSKELSDLQKAYNEAVKAALSYASAQFDVARKIGLTEKQLRLYADAAAMAAAPTDELRKKIQATAKAREIAFARQSAKDFEADVIQPLRDELTLYGLIGPAREEAALGLEKEAFFAKHVDEGLEETTRRWQKYYSLRKTLIDKDVAADREVENIRRAREEFDALVDAGTAAGNAIAQAFGRAGKTLGDTLGILSTYLKRQREIAQLAKENGWDAARIRSENGRLATDSLASLAWTVGKAIGGLFRGKRHETSSTAIGAGGWTTTANNDAARGATSAIGDNVRASIDAMVEQLGGSMRRYLVNVSMRDGVYTVSGAGGTAYRGKDGDMASAAALREAIAQGAVAGLSESMARLIAQGNFDNQFKKALSFQSVLDEIRKKADPTGFAIAGINRELSKMTAIMTEAGASTSEFASVQKWYTDQIAEARAAEQKAIYDQLATQRGLEARLAEALGRSEDALTLQRWNELAATDAQYRGLLQATYAAEDAAKAQAAAAQLLSGARSLEIRLLQAQGKATEALALQRQIEREQMDTSLRALLDQVNAAEDAAQAIDAASALLNTQRELEIRLLQAQGKATEALALQRQIEREQMDTSLRALLDQVNAAEDAAKAIDAMRARFEGFANDLIAFRDELTGTTLGGGATYASALAQVRATGALAAAGNEAALGRFTDVGKTFLDLAKNQAGSLAAYQQDVALVRSYLDSAIAVSSAAAGISDSGTSGGGGGAAVPDAANNNGSGSGTPMIDLLEELRAEIAAQRIEVRAANEALVVANNKMARLQEGWNRGGSVGVATDADTPLQVEVA